MVKVDGEKNERYQNGNYDDGGGRCCFEGVVPKFDPTKYGYFHQEQKQPFNKNQSQSASAIAQAYLILSKTPMLTL